MGFQAPNTKMYLALAQVGIEQSCPLIGPWQKQGETPLAVGPGQLGQQPEWRQRHSSEPSHQLHNKVIMGLGIKLVTCVIIFLRTRAERAFLKESLLGHPESTEAAADECTQTQQ